MRADSKKCRREIEKPRNKNKQFVFQMMDQQWVKRIRDNKQFAQQFFLKNYFLFFYVTAERKFYASGLFQRCSQTEFPLCVYVVSWLVWPSSRRCRSRFHCRIMNFPVRCVAVCADHFPESRYLVRGLNASVCSNWSRNRGERWADWNAIVSCATTTKQGRTCVLYTKMRRKFVAKRDIDNRWIDQHVGC